MLFPPSHWRLMYKETWKPQAENGRAFVCLAPCMTKWSRALLQTWNCQGLYVSRDMFLSYWAIIRFGAALLLQPAFPNCFDRPLSTLRGKTVLRSEACRHNLKKKKKSKQEKNSTYQDYAGSYRGGFVLKTENWDNVQMRQSFVVKYTRVWILALWLPSSKSLSRLFIFFQLQFPWLLKEEDIT